MWGKLRMHNAYSLSNSSLYLGRRAIYTFWQPSPFTLVQCVPTVGFSARSVSVDVSMWSGFWIVFCLGTVGKRRALICVYGYHASLGFLKVIFFIGKFGTKKVPLCLWGRRTWGKNLCQLSDLLQPKACVWLSLKRLFLSCFVCKMPLEMVAAVQMASNKIPLWCNYLLLPQMAEIWFLNPFCYDSLWNMKIQGKW